MEIDYSPPLYLILLYHTDTKRKLYYRFISQWIFYR